MRKQPPIATYIGIGLAVVGFIAIAGAWDGASSLDYVQGQFPYLLSGGVAGIGAIIVGVTIMVLQVVRDEGAAQVKELERLTASVVALQRALSSADPFDPATTGEYRPRPRTSPNGNGHPQAADDHTEPIPVATGDWQQAT